MKLKIRVGRGIKEGFVTSCVLGIGSVYSFFHARQSKLKFCHVSGSSMENVLFIFSLCGHLFKLLNRICNTLETCKWTVKVEATWG